MDFLARAEAAASKAGLLAGALALIAAGGAAPALAQAAADGQAADAPGLLNRLLECRALTDPAARLKCYDDGAAAVSTARSSGDLLVADRTQVQAEREAKFGAATDRGPWGDEQSEVKERTFVVKSLQQTPGLLFIFVMEDGSVWQQTESVIMRRPKPGDQVLVKSGAMGGFMAKVNEGRQFRIKRVR